VVFLLSAVLDISMPITHLAPDLTINYKDENPGGQSSVLLLHGLGANSSSWSLQIPDLAAAGFRVIVPDTPGFGQSPYLKKFASASDWASALAEFLRSLEIERTDVVGISMGGVQTLQLALDYPQFVNKLVLVNTYSHLNAIDLRVLPYYLVRTLLIYALSPRSQARMVAKRLFPDPSQHELRDELISQIGQADPGGYRASVRILSRFNVTDRLHEINAPTLVITGDKDTTVPPEVQSLLVKKIPCSTQVRLSAGHAASVEIPDQFNQVLLKYLLTQKSANSGIHSHEISPSYLEI
jgi:pimeloyl-ACP methyl ester carboxylesterase